MSTTKSTADMAIKADDVQHGGSHYKDTPVELQHWNVVAALGWDYYVGTATKYLWRLGKKDDPIVELDKAIHYLQKKKELILAERAKPPRAPLACCPVSRPKLEKAKGLLYAYRCANCNHAGPRGINPDFALKAWEEQYRVTSHA